MIPFKQKANMRDVVLDRLDGLLDSLLYQVSDFEWARLLWNPENRNSILSLVKRQHGRSSAQKFSEQVSLQVLQTSLRAIRKDIETNLQRRYREIGGGPSDDDLLPHGHDTSKIFIAVRIATSVLDPIHSSFQNLLRVLLLSLAHSTLLVILNVDEGELATIYRTRIDFIRQNFDHPACGATRDTVISTIKKVISQIVAKNKAAAKRLVQEFSKIHSLEGLHKLINALLIEITAELTPLRFLTRHAKTERVEQTTNGPSFFSDEEGDHSGSKNAARRNEQRRLNLSVMQPAFFSDVEEDGADRRGDIKPTRRQLQNGVLGPTILFPEKQSDQEPQLRKASRAHTASKQVNPHSPSDGSGTGHVTKKKRCFTSNLYADCKRITRAGIRFPPPSSDCFDIIDQLARDRTPKRSRVRTPANSPDQPDQQGIQPGKERVERQRRNKSNVCEGGDLEPDDPFSDGNVRHEVLSNSVHSDGKGTMVATENANGKGESPFLMNDSDSEGSESDSGEDKGVDLDEVGQKVRCVKRLRKANRDLKRNAVRDPLDSSLRDADSLSWMAKRRRRRSLDRPSSGARDASPLPESPSSVTKRRRPVRMPVLESASDSDEDDVFEPTRLRDEPHIGGMKVARGRFTKEEDDWLVEGLQKYGWGSWALIAKNFGDGKARYTRNGVSLKDRARTLQLDPTIYIRPSGRLESRGRRSNLTPVRGKKGAGSNNNNDNDDNDGNDESNEEIESDENDKTGEGNGGDTGSKGSGGNEGNEENEDNEAEGSDKPNEEEESTATDNLTG